MPITRRDMLSLISSSTFILSASAAAQASVTAMTPIEGKPVSFPQGVASGDPQADAVMLWTRAEPDDLETSVILQLQLSTTSEFSSLLLDITLHTGPDSDHTVRAYVDGLTPDSIYYYRFLGPAGSSSRLGRTRTAPADDAERPIHLAQASCQSFEQSHYGAWARMLEDDKAAATEDQIDFVLHVGDFIYERSWHQRVDGTSPARRIPAFPDGVSAEKYNYAITAADYRHLYKTYLSDPWLQEARARWPFVCTWDDHEFSNDNFQSYSTYHGDHTLEAQRKLDANKAWFEYIPAVLSELQQPAHDFQGAALGDSSSANNAAAKDSLCIYRHFKWGKHLDLVLTDSRSYRTPPCVDKDLATSLGLPLNPVKLVEMADAGHSYNSGNPPTFLPYGDGATANPGLNREPGTLLGKTQKAWFLSTLKNASGSWKIWGNSLPLVPMRLDLSSIPFGGLEDSVIGVDAWSGYPGEMAQLMDAVQANKITGLVSLSGDHHMHAAGTVNRSASEPDSPPVAVDFSCAGIASQPVFADLVAAADDGSEDFRTLVYKQQGAEKVPAWHMSMLQGVLAAMIYDRSNLPTVAQWLGPNEANPGLEYIDTTTNGYGRVTVAAQTIDVALISIAPQPEPFETIPEISYQANFRTALWNAGESPVIDGPHFVRGAPFPFKPPTV